MRHVFCAVLAATLAGCGGGETEQAVQACVAAVAEKLGDGRNYSLDPASLSASAQEQDDHVVHLQAPIVFDAGLPREYTQTVDCRARFDEDGGAPDVISLNFIW